MNQSYGITSTLLECFGKNACNILCMCHTGNLGKHGTLASNAGETCFMWSKDRDKGCSWHRNRVVEKRLQSSPNHGELTARHWTCPKKVILSQLLCCPTQVIKNYISSSIIFTSMLENMVIFPYKNGNFEESLQRYVLITPATFVPSLAKQGWFGLLTKLQEWCLILVW